MTSYKFAYSVDGLTYTFVSSYDDVEWVFEGNYDSNTVVTHSLEIAVAARYVRVYPQSWRQHMSMRWEVYGCDTSKWSKKACLPTLFR